MFAYSAKQIESTRAEMERAERAYDLNLVAELKHGKLPILEAELEELENTDKNEDAILKEEVAAEEIHGYCCSMDWGSGN